MVGAFDERELALLAEEADEELLAGLAHRFGAPEEAAVAGEGLPFIGHVLAGTVADAALRALMPELDLIARRATSRRRRERVFSSNAFSGNLDLGRIALAQPHLDLWPVLHSRRIHDTPENAVIAATLRAVAAWARGSASTYAGWLGVELFARIARSAASLGRDYIRTLGELPLLELGAAALFPLGWERLALRQAEPAVYRRALELCETLLALVDPRRQLARIRDAPWVVAAMLAGLNEAGLQHTAFELWVASRIVDAYRQAGFDFEFPHRARTPLAIGRKNQRRVELWWQTSKPLIEWPSPREHELHLTDGRWVPLGLRPDLVLVHADSAVKDVLCVECKNKARDTADSKDLAQAFGYLAHYSALRWCALVYRSVDEIRLYRRAPTSQRLLVLEAPVAQTSDAGAILCSLVAIGPGGADPHHSAQRLISLNDPFANSK